MKDRVKFLYMLIEQNIRDGNVFYEDTPADDFVLVDFFRELEVILVETNQFLSSELSQRLTQDEFQLLLKIFTFILTDVYLIGNCGEKADYALINFLKMGIQNSVETLQIKGLDSNFKEGRHSTVALDRDRKTTLSTTINKWGKVTTFDAWYFMEPRFYNVDETISVSRDLTQGILPKITEIKSALRWDGNLTADTCVKVVIFLKELKNKITKQLFQEAMKRTGRKDVNIAKEINLILKRMDEEIQDFQHLAKFPPVSPEIVLSATDLTLFKAVKPIRDKMHESKAIKTSTKNFDNIANQFYRRRTA